ncbi:MAG TPA: hypothetical protein VIJ50_09275, partial [Solirubrobacteraceae bacterium]
MPPSRSTPTSQRSDPSTSSSPARSSSAEVYATARGPLARIASPVAARARSRRHERFFAMCGLSEGARVLDVGCGALGLRA